MRKRVWILLFLAIALLTERGYAIYQFLFDLTRASNFPFRFTIDDKYLAFDSIDQSSPAFHAGLRKNDRLLETYNNRGDGVHISGLFDFGFALRSSPWYEPWVLLIQRPEATQEMGIILPPQADSNLESDERFLLIWTRFVLPFAFIFAGLFIAFSRSCDNRALLACFIFLSLAGVVAANQNIFTYPAGIREIGLILQILQYSFVGYFVLNFFLVFPVLSPVEQKAPWLKNVAFVISAGVFVLSLLIEFTKAYSFESYGSLAKVHSVNETFFPIVQGILFVLGIASLIANKRKDPEKDHQRRMTMLFAGIAALFVTLIIVALYRFSGFRSSFWWVAGPAVITGLFFPLCFAYATRQHRIFGMNVLARKGLRYLLASRGSYIIAAALIFVALYLTVGVATFHLEVSRIPGVGWRLGAMAALAFAVAMTLPIITRSLMPYIDRKFFESAYNSNRILGDLSRAIQGQPIRSEMLLSLAISQINRALSVDHVAIFLRGAKIVDASPDSDESQEYSISWIRRNAVDYQCCEIRSRSGPEAKRIVAAEELQDLLLPSDSFIVKELQKILHDPCALEVDLDNPESQFQKTNSFNEESALESDDKGILLQLNSRLLVPMITNRQLLGFLSLGEKLTEEPYSTEEKDFLLSVAHQMALAIEYSIQSDRTAEQEKLKREIEIAKQVQSHLFPQRIPPIKSLDYIGICKAAREVGGDYYDFLEIGPGRLGFVVADISGKGISAALLMASLQALLRSHAHIHADRAELLVWDINRLMHSSTTNGKYASLFYGFYDDLSRRLAYVNAGHLPPILYRSDGSIVRLKTGGMVVGMLPDTAYRQDLVELKKGDILLIFTDGITEAMNTKDQEFGEERLLSLIPTLANLPAASISETILKNIAEYVGVNPQHDDSTLVVIKAI